MRSWNDSRQPTNVRQLVLCEIGEVKDAARRKKQKTANDEWASASTLAGLDKLEKQLEKATKDARVVSDKACKATNEWCVHVENQLKKLRELALMAKPKELPKLLEDIRKFKKENGL